MRVLTVLTCLQVPGRVPYALLTCLHYMCRADEHGLLDDALLLAALLSAQNDLILRLADQRAACDIRSRLRILKAIAGRMREQGIALKEIDLNDGSFSERGAHTAGTLADDLTVHQCAGIAWQTSLDKCTSSSRSRSLQHLPALQFRGCCLAAELSIQGVVETFDTYQDLQDRLGRVGAALQNGVSTSALRSNANNTTNPEMHPVKRVGSTSFDFRGTSSHGLNHRGHNHKRIAGRDVAGLLMAWAMPGRIAVPAFPEEKKHTVWRFSSGRVRIAVPLPTWDRKYFWAQIRMCSCMCSAKLLHHTSLARSEPSRV